LKEVPDLKGLKPGNLQYSVLEHRRPYFISFLL